MQDVTYAVDVGRIARVDAGTRAGADNRFGWARISPKNRPILGEDYGYDADSLRSCLRSDLSTGLRVALGIEAPLFVPCRQDQEMLGTARGKFESAIGRAFTASGGASVLTCGLVQLPYLLGDHEDVVTTSVREFESGSQLLVWEAFVSGKHRGTVAHPCLYPADSDLDEHGTSHVCDAWSVGATADRALTQDSAEWQGTCAPIVLDQRVFAGDWSFGIDIVEVACGRRGRQSRDGWDFRIVQRCKPHSYFDLKKSGP